MNASSESGLWAMAISRQGVFPVPSAGTSDACEIGVVVTNPLLDGSVAGILAKRAKHTYAGRRGEDLQGIAGEERCDRLSEHKGKLQMAQQPKPGGSGGKNQDAGEP